MLVGAFPGVARIPLKADDPVEVKHVVYGYNIRYLLIVNQVRARSGEELGTQDHQLTGKRRMNRRVKVSEELRAVEREVDDAYRTNRLLSLPRSEALWYFLAACEEQYMRLHYHGRQADTAFVDAVVNLAKWPLRWLWKDCETRGRLRQQHVPDDYYTPASDLGEFGGKYEWFEAAYSYATMGRLSLELNGRHIRPTWESCLHARYDAYDRLRDAAEKSMGNNSNNPFPVPQEVGRTVQVRGDSFAYALNPKMFERVYVVADNLLSTRFRLPGQWALPTAQLGQYAAVLKAIWVLSYIHCIARVAAVDMGCGAFGYSRALVVMERGELITRFSRYLGLEEELVRNIVEELTFGGRGVTNPDIALQPLVPLEPSHYGWAPHLLLGLSLERNLLVLLNKLPHGKRAYSRLSEEREELMRETICDELADTGLHFWWGKVPGWGAASEVDLAVVDYEVKCCLLLELKAFLEPADPREVNDKAEAIEKGVEQIGRRRDALCGNRKSLNDAVKIDDTFAVHFAVVSESSTGCGMARVGDVTVVRSVHLVERIKSERDLRRVCEWLSERRFLPVPGRDYEELPYPVTIRDWTLEWYRIKPLTENYN